MRVIIRSKTDQHILYESQSQSGEAMENPKNIYPEFNAKTMEMGISKEGVIPEFFEIDKEGQVQELPHPGYVTIGTHDYPLGYKRVKGKMIAQTPADLIKAGTIHLNTPFEYISNGKVKTRSLEEVYKDKALSSEEDRKKYLNEIGTAIRMKIKKRYSVDQELKITKGYITWIASKNKNPELAKAYEEMEAYVEEVKSSYKKMKDYANLKSSGSKTSSISKDSTKAELQAFLNSNNVSYLAKDTKATLLKKAKKVK